jgi:Zn-finger nucleic acid-binding protein
LKRCAHRWIYFEMKYRICPKCRGVWSPRLTEYGFEYLKDDLRGGAYFNQVQEGDKMPEDYSKGRYYGWKRI